MYTMFTVNAVHMLYYNVQQSALRDMKSNSVKTQQTQINQSTSALERMKQNCNACRRQTRRNEELRSTKTKPLIELVSSKRKNELLVQYIAHCRGSNEKGTNKQETTCVQHTR